MKHMSAEPTLQAAIVFSIAAPLKRRTTKKAAEQAQPAVQAESLCWHVERRGQSHVSVMTGGNRYDFTIHALSADGPIAALVPTNAVSSVKLELSDGRALACIDVQPYENAAESAVQLLKLLNAYVGE